MTGLKIRRVKLKSTVPFVGRLSNFTGNIKIVQILSFFVKQKKMKKRVFRWMQQLLWGGLSRTETFDGWHEGAFFFCLGREKIEAFRFLADDYGLSLRFLCELCLQICSIRRNRGVSFSRLTGQRQLCVADIFPSARNRQVSQKIN